MNLTILVAMIGMCITALFGVEKGLEFFRIFLGLAAVIFIGTTLWHHRKGHRKPQRAKDEARELQVRRMFHGTITNKLETK